MSKQTTHSPETVEQIRENLAAIREETTDLQRTLEDCDNPALEKNADQLDRIVEVLEMNLPPGSVDGSER